MAIKGNSRIFGKHHISRTIIAALFSVSLILGMSGVNLPLQQLQQEAYAQEVPPTQTTPSSQMPPASPICDSKQPTLQFGLTGANVAELQRLLIQLGYGSLLGMGTKITYILIGLNGYISGSVNIAE
jgi:hypothetical protein